MVVLISQMCKANISEFHGRVDFTNVMGDPKYQMSPNGTARMGLAGLMVYERKTRPLISATPLAIARY
jgi:hypothetical protein